jgi:hypothetical protein
VEELVVVWNATNDIRVIQWRGFFNHLRQMKVLHVPWQVALGVAHSFQQGDQEEPAMDLLPALEQVHMNMTQFRPSLLELNSQNHGTIPDAFKPLISARKKVGHPITLSFLL